MVERNTNGVQILHKNSPCGQQTGVLGEARAQDPWDIRFGRRKQWTFSGYLSPSSGSQVGKFAMGS